MKVRTRFAPSPTGYMHIGNLRTALYGWLFARKHDGTFILRIEDTDRNRLIESAGDVIFNTLADTGLTYDEGPGVGGDFGPYVQSERQEIYQKYAKQLVEQGDAYYCFCTKERLQEAREQAEKGGKVFKYDKHCAHFSKEEAEARIAAGEDYVIRQNIPDTGVSSYRDQVFGEISVHMEDMEDNVLLKADGWPTYNLANVIDDHLMEITHVIRGLEYLSSTPKYNLLYDAFGWERPQYIHLPVVMRDKTRKLSKRHGDASYEDLIEQGYLKEAIINYIALLGWSPSTEQEIFSLEELVEAFSLDGLSKSPSVFDREKLTWMNGAYIRALSTEEFLERAKPYMGDLPGGIDVHAVAALIQPRLETLVQIPEKIAFLKGLPAYDLDLYRHKKMKSSPETALPILEAVHDVLSMLEDFSNDTIYQALVGFAEGLGVKNGQVLWPVRVAISGLPVTPGGATELAALLGKEETLARIETSIGMLQNMAK